LTEPEHPDGGPLPSVLNRLNADARRNWQPATPPRWATFAGVVLMLAILVSIIVAIRTGAA
jgi:hypothetical protein